MHEFDSAIRMHEVVVVIVAGPAVFGYVLLDIGHAVKKLSITPLVAPAYITR